MWVLLDPEEVWGEQREGRSQLCPHLAVQQVGRGRQLVQSRRETRGPQQSLINQHDKPFWLYFLLWLSRHHFWGKRSRNKCGVNYLEYLRLCPMAILQAWHCTCHPERRSIRTLERLIRIVCCLCDPSLRSLRRRRIMTLLTILLCTSVINMSRFFKQEILVFIIIIIDSIS